MTSDPFKTLRPLVTRAGTVGHYHSLPAFADTGSAIARLPVSLRIVLESLLRHCDGRRITTHHVRELAAWHPNAPRSSEIPFTVARVVLQDFTGVPLLCDLAAMRDAAVAHGAAAELIEPLVPVDLVVDHSVMVDYYRRPDALALNMQREFERNRERYEFLKWGMQAFERFRVVPPGIGIVHQVNLEYLCPGLQHRDGLLFPDTLVGTDSHTTMINALGVVGWGVGGIEAEAAMLGQPVYLLTPDVVGVELSGTLAEGVTATDLVLSVTERLRAEKVVGQFVEFFGDGAASLSVTDRATIANMAPEYGATMGFFPVDARTVEYLRQTGRSAEQVETFEAYWRAQQLFGMPQAGSIDYSRVIVIDLDAIVPSLAGPKRPQDRIPLPQMRERFESALGHAPAAPGTALRDGDIVIAAITSCTNTSNPGVMLAAGLLAQKAVARGLRVAPQIKTSLAPGSRVVTEYLQRAGLLEALDALGFGLTAYGCTTCIGNAGELAPEIAAAITQNQLSVAAVLSGNRNFEARIHPLVKANFLASPPLVVAFALAGRVDIDLTHEPLGLDAAGQPVYLRELWPHSAEIEAVRHWASDPDTYRRLYADFSADQPLWNAIDGRGGATYAWRESSYIARPPFFDEFAAQPAPLPPIRGARALLLLGDSVTTDHISPAGSFRAESPAGQYLQARGVTAADFNSYGSRRGNHEVMLRGTFANVRLRNRMLPPAADGSPVEGGYTLLDGVQTSVYEAAMAYRARGVPTLVFAGEEYGTGSSRDWAAKGTQLLGVRAVIARSFERIHRSNLVGMGVLPLQFAAGDSIESLSLDGSETFDLDLPAELRPQQSLRLVIQRGGRRYELMLRSRLDTPVELAYFRHGGILPYVLRQLLAAPAAKEART